MRRVISLAKPAIKNFKIDILHCEAGVGNLTLAETEGLIIKSVKYGDFSNILTIITRDMGRISAIVSRSGSGGRSKFSAARLFSYNKFVLFKSGDKPLMRVNETSIIEPFEGIQGSIENLSYAAYFAEAANKISTENTDASELLQLLLNSLFLLCKNTVPRTKIKLVFELRALAVEGYMPDLDNCGGCGRPDNLTRFGLRDGSSYCAECAEGMPDCAEINDFCREVIEYICTVDPKKIFSFSISEDALKYLGEISERYFEFQIGHRFQTLTYLKTLGL